MENKTAPILPVERLTLRDGLFEFSHALADRLGLREGSTVALQQDRQNATRYFLVIEPNPENGRQLSRIGTERNTRLSFTDVVASDAIRSCYSLIEAKQHFTLPADGYREGDATAYLLTPYTPEPVPATA